MKIHKFDILTFLSNHFVEIFFLMAGYYIYRLITKKNRQHRNAKKIIKKMLDSHLGEPLTLHPEIDPSLCAGCGACTKVCPEGDILKLISNKAVLVSPTKCVGHGECERACPFDAIKLVFGTKTKGMDIPRLSSHYETNVSGLYIAGELGGMGLIRNAVKQGYLAAQHALTQDGLTKQHDVQYDVIIVGAGPAGLAASLVAIAQKKKYLIMEQGGFGGTVYNFPRQKIVMSHPFELPIFGKMKFDSNKVSKEDLLKRWEWVKKKSGLKVQEQTQFLNLEKLDSIFKVKTNKGEFTSRKVILAMGVRGSPRRLGVPGEDKSKVTYSLLDPEQYQNKDIIVVGGGNAGVESAQMLADSKWRNRVHLLVRSETFDRCNEDNINRIRELEKANLVKIWFSSTVQEIHDTEVAVKRGSEIHTLKNHFVFIFAGADMPHKFLMSLGIKIDKKFGEAQGA